MPSSNEKTKAIESRNTRVPGFDVIRGFTIVSMVLFHAMYDLVYIYGLRVPWFENEIIQNCWRCSISWMFLFIAGWMCTFSSSNLKRGLKYALVAACVFVATSVARIDTPINFGIIFCMATSTLIISRAQRGLAKINPSLGFLACLALFCFTYQAPTQSYDLPGLAWLGLPDPAFASGDYYPLLPYFFMYATGYFFARFYESKDYGYEIPPFALSCKPLELLGHHSLLIYLLHQPLLIGLMELVFMLPTAQ